MTTYTTHDLETCAAPCDESIGQHRSVGNVLLCPDGIHEFVSIAEAHDEMGADSDAEVERAIENRYFDEDRDLEDEANDIGLTWMRDQRETSAIPFEGQF